MDLEVMQNKIYEIRGERVMLDRDLAELYQVETKIHLHKGNTFITFGVRFEL